MNVARLIMFFHKRARAIFATIAVFSAILLAPRVQSEIISDCQRSAGEPAEDICARAILEIDEALRHDPRNALNYFHRGSAQLAKGDVAAAVEDFGAAIHLMPGNADLYLARGRAYERKLAFKDAVRDLDMSISLNPASVSAHLSRGIAHLYIGDLQTARTDLDTALALDPTYPAAGLWLEIVLWRSGLPGRLAKSAAVDESNWPGPILRLYQGKSTAAEAIAAAKDSDAERARLHACEADFYVGAYLLQKSDLAGAVSLFRRGIGNCPKAYSAWVGSNAELQRLRAPTP